MSRHHIEKITCPNCQKESDFLIWDSINTSLEADMKEKLEQGKFLNGYVPHAGLLNCSIAMLADNFRYCCFDKC